MARSFVPDTAWGQRLAYELIYLTFGFRRSGMFNVGFMPVRPAIAADPTFAIRPKQIELYAQMLDEIPWQADDWRQSDCLELGAGCGGGLLYLKTHRTPRSSAGIERSYIAAWRARQLGVEVNQGDAGRLPFEGESFDCLFCVDALNYFPATALGEAFRVLRPGGYLQLGESFSGPPAAAEAHFRRIAADGGFDLNGFRDATNGVWRSLQAGSAGPPFVSRLPSSLRDRLKETLFLEGSDRLRRWEMGQSCFALVTLRRPG